MQRTKVPFYFGLGSRYSYLASTQLEQIEISTDCEFDWLPLQSGELVRRANNGQSPFHDNPQSGQYDWSYRQRDAEAWADYYGVPYTEPANFRTDPDDLAKACWVADLDGLLKPMARQIFKAIFIDARVITREVLGDIASEIGLNGNEIITALDQPEIIAKHETVLDRALKDNVFGVPSFFIGERLLWGNDRLSLVEYFLKKSG